MKSRVAHCASCLHWLQYPLLPGAGVCENPENPDYYRIKTPSDEPCPLYSPAHMCKDCHFWCPVDFIPVIGQCKNEGVASFGKALPSDNASGDCFKERSFTGLELCWCSTCRQTVPDSEFTLHRTHQLFIGTASFPVEFMLEVTHAGD